MSGISHEQKLALHQRLVNEFNNEELELLFFKLEDKRIEDIADKVKGKAFDVMELIQYFERRRRLHELIDMVNRERSK